MEVSYSIISHFWGACPNIHAHYMPLHQQHVHLQKLQIVLKIVQSVKIFILHTHIFVITQSEAIRTIKCTLFVPVLDSQHLPLNKPPPVSHTLIIQVAGKAQAISDNQENKKYYTGVQCYIEYLLRLRATILSVRLKWPTMSNSYIVCFIKHTF